MKKIIILIVATVLCLCTLFAGCGDSTGYKNTVTSSSFAGIPKSNGGFAVEKGEYVYYINGVEVNTADNTYGKVVKGALVRTKLADLGTNNAAAEMVVPALFVTGSYNAGFYIYGDNIYYASPRSEKNKEGEVENSKLDFFKTSFDGKKAVNLVTVDDNTTNYRFVEVGSVVYLVLETVNADGEKVLKVINTTDTKAEPYETKKLESVIFANGEQDSDIYFTRVKHNETLEKDEAYNEIYRLVLGATIEEKLVLSGNGLYPTDDQQVTSGFGIQGVKFTLVKDLENAVIVKVDYVETDVTTVTNYYAIEKNGYNYVRINNGTVTASSIFTDASLYKYDAENDSVSILYLDASLGLMKYEYSEANKENNKVNDYRTRLFYDKDLVTYTVKFWNGEYLYLTDSNNYYHRVNYSVLLDNDDTTVASVEQITCLASSTSWYQPEIIGDYFLTVYSAEPYNSMVFVRKNEAFEKDEESDKYLEIEAIQKSDIESIENNLKLRLGLATDELTESIHSYYRNTFGAKAYKEYFGEEKYNEYFG